MANRQDGRCRGAAFTTPTSKTSRTETLSMPMSRVFTLADLTQCCYLLFRNKAQVTEVWPDPPCGCMHPLCFFHDTSICPTPAAVTYYIQPPRVQSVLLSFDFF